MKRLVGALLVIALLTIGGCGGGSSPPPNIVTQIFSDPALDGDITKDAVTGLFKVVQGMSPTVQSVFAGVDSIGESRAFLDFPLTGASGVPSNAVIVQATLDIVIKSVNAPAVPIIIDLVSFQPPTLVESDFDRAILLPRASTAVFSILSADVHNSVTVDVTALMVEAQRLGLPDFQLRIFRDMNAVSQGLIEINDATGPNSGALAPLLEVTYF